MKELFPYGIWKKRIGMWFLGTVSWLGLEQAAGAVEAPSAVDVTSSVFGRLPDGTDVDLYTLTNGEGMEVKVMTYGATLVSVKAPDRKGNVENIALCLDTFDDYAKGHPLFGSIVGRFANRIKNARFTLDGAAYPLTPNAGNDHIHGGREGFQRIVWDAVPVQEDRRAAVSFTHTSPDGHEGYPGNLKVTVTYELTGENELVLHYTAETDKPTHLNLTNHVYWNLAGSGSGEVFDQVMKINADKYLLTDPPQFPTGAIASVEGTPLDFREPHAIGERIERVEGKNYDHCYVLNKREENELSWAAEAFDPASGRLLTVYTTQPGVQLYTAIHLNPRLKAGGKAYGPYHGFCLETQHFPDSPNIPHFPSTVLRPGEKFDQKTVFQFSVK